MSGMSSAMFPWTSSTIGSSRIGLKSMMAKGLAPKTVHNVHGLISAAMNTAEMLGYIPRNPCRGVQLPPY